MVDYTATDFARTGHAYDVIFDVAGTSSFAHCRPALSDTGIYLTTAPSPSIFASMTWTARFGRKKAAVAFTGLRDAAVKRADLLCTAELVEASVLVPVVDSTYPLARIADAYRCVEAGHKRGNVVVTMT